jgi:hypothetical protein
MTGRFGLAISFPLKPALMKTGPSHLIMLKVTANAIPLNAREATNGAPSPSKVLASTPRQAPARMMRLHVSRRERELDFGLAIMNEELNYSPIPFPLHWARQSGGK